MFLHVLSGFSFYHVLVYFVVFSVAGYVVEVMYAATVLGKFVNRGFLNGPWCPIYGFGVVIVGIMLKPISGSLPVLFLGSLFATSLLEYFTGFVLEKVFNKKWWDYSEMPFNLNGYVCLKFSLVWGIACTFVIKLILPVADWLIRVTPRAVGLSVCLTVVIVMLGDFTATFIAIAGIKRKLRIVKSFAESIRSNTDDMGSYISRETLHFKEKYEEILHSLTLRWTQRRILTAFPNLGNKSIEEVFDRLRSQIKDALEKGEKLAAGRQRKFIAEYDDRLPEGEADPFAHSLGFTKLFCLFMIGSTAGFLLETLWALIVLRRFEVRVGLVLGPLIPLYGFGAVLITLILHKSYNRRDLYVFAWSAVIGGGFEYLCSVIQELALGTVSWDYSGTAANIGGRTNLMYVLIWGMLGLLWVKDFYPVVSEGIERIPRKIGSPLVILFCVFILADIGVSGAAVVRRGERMEGREAGGIFERWLDAAFDDEYLDYIFPNMVYVD